MPLIEKVLSYHEKKCQQNKCVDRLFYQIASPFNFLSFSFLFESVANSIS